MEMGLFGIELDPGLAPLLILYVSLSERKELEETHLRWRYCYGVTLVGHLFLLSLAIETYDIHHT
jgi:hypothetical protein